ncbi:unnamed protein product [Ilex paraguariensis]|uniref:Uncharacterized protein n=1 Tax=Ilex paraguariensis TaxID=185542 RepID=A0ABC8U6R9_9AQUA
MTRTAATRSSRSILANGKQPLHPSSVGVNHQATPEQQNADQTQAEELIVFHQASSSATVKNKMGLVIQGDASTSSQQDILVHDHHITKITVNESNSPQMLMQPGVTLSSNKFE